MNYKCRKSKLAVYFYAWVCEQIKCESVWEYNTNYGV